MLVTRYFSKWDAQEEKRSQATRKENILVLRSIHTLGLLTKANTIAIRDGKCNGELHAALDDFTKVESELYDYLLEQNAGKL